MSNEHAAYYQSPIGFIEITIADNRISGILFIEEQKSNSVSHPLLENAIEQLQQYFNGERTRFDLPLHQNGTDFQQRVWSELINIPFGKIAYYLQHQFTWRRSAKIIAGCLCG